MRQLLFDLAVAILPGSVVLHLVASGFSQTTPLLRPTVTMLMDQLKKGPLMAVTVNQLADAHAVQAVPLLKEKFDKLREPPAAPNTFPSEESLDKSIIASALVRLGE